MNQTRFRKVLALLLCLTLCLSLIPSAWAEEYFEDYTDESEGFDEFNESDGFDELNGPDVGYDEVYTPSPVWVNFRPDPADARIFVYSSEEYDESGFPIMLVPEYDNSYLLMPGNYLVDAECDGYEPVFDIPLTVNGEDMDFPVALNPLAIFAPVSIITDGIQSDIKVYDPAVFDENGTPVVYQPGEDGKYLLTPGRYAYEVHADGFEPLEGQEFEVLNDEALEISPILTAVSENTSSEETDLTIFEETPAAEENSTTESTLQETILEEKPAGEGALEEILIEEAISEKSASPDSDLLLLEENELVLAPTNYPASGGDGTVLLQNGEAYLADGTAGAGPVLLKHYDNNVIVGFDPLEDEAAIETEFKLALVELEKSFPAQLNVQLGGTVIYRQGTDDKNYVIRVEGNTPQSLDAVWKCKEDYDESFDEYHFVPEFSELELAEGIELPQITVRVLGEYQTPPLPPITMEDRPEIPIMSTFTGDGSWLYHSVFPEYYNAYYEGLLPPIRNQNPYGTCWAHGTIGAVESDLIVDGSAGTDIDLSELHLSYFTYHGFYDEKGCNAGDGSTVSGTAYLDWGGNSSKAFRTLANLVGAVRESDVPYSMAESYDNRPYDARAYHNAQITGVYEMNLQDFDTVKDAILNHGGVSVAFNANSSYYSSTYNSYYYPVQTGTNHIVMLVGWDDNFPKEHFRAGVPVGNGAWLVRNSWGYEGEGYGGYFWMSYYDNSLYNYATACDARDWQYEHCYAYDNCPLDTYYSFSDSATLEQTFWVDPGEKIMAVGVATGSPWISVTATVDCNGMTSTETAFIPYSGYQLIELSNPLFSVGPDRSQVTVKITMSSTSQFWIPFENSWDVYTHGCGGGGTIVNGENLGRDGRIKLFTDNCVLENHGYIDGIEWTLDGSGVLKISGTGPIPDFVSSDTLAWRALRDNIKHVIISNDVTRIGNYAFSGCTNLESAVIQSSVTEIGYEAFSGCYNLANIEFSPSVESIDYYAFKDCSRLSVIYYGTEEQWRSMIINDGNECLTQTRRSVFKAPQVCLDNIVVGPHGEITVQGWAFDENDLNANVIIQVIVSGSEGDSYKYGLWANTERPDVDAVFGVGPNHGFNSMIKVSERGEKTLNFYAYDTDNNLPPVLFASRTVNLSDVRPLGNLDSVSVDKSGKISVQGWAFDEDKQDEPVGIFACIGGPADEGNPIVARFFASSNRPDIETVFGVGAYHGFDTTFKPYGFVGPQKIYIYMTGVEEDFYTGNINPDNVYLLGTADIIIPETGRAPMACLDSVKASAKKISVKGWAFDEDTPDNYAYLEVYSDGPRDEGGSYVMGFSASYYRPDVGAAFGGIGDYHGFEFTGDYNGSSGTHTLYFYVYDSESGAPVLFDTRTVTIPVGGLPTANLDNIEVVSGNKLRTTGWAFDGDDVETPVYIEVYSDGLMNEGGQSVGAFVTGSPRPDVGTVFGGIGDYHGFDATFVCPSGEHTFYFYAYGDEWEPVNFATRTFTVPEGKMPVVCLDSVAAGPGGRISVKGWAYDEDTPEYNVSIEVYSGAPWEEGGNYVGYISADSFRPDVGAAFGGIGDYHGIDAVIATSDRGAVTLYFYAYDVGDWSRKELFATRDVTIQEGHQPVFCLDNVSAVAGKIKLSGWTYDEDVPELGVRIEVYGDAPRDEGGNYIGTLYAESYRPDLPAVFGDIGDYHGFNDSVYYNTESNTLDLYIYIYDVGDWYNPILSAVRTVTVSAGGPPRATLDNVSVSSGGYISVSGWAYDEDDVDASVLIETTIGGPIGSGAIVAAFDADSYRPDVGAAFGNIGDYHGFDTAFTVSQQGSQTLYFYAIDDSTGVAELFATRDVVIF